MKPVSREPIHVTDHAVLRYLERAIGLNIEAVRQHIAGVCGTPAAFGVSAVERGPEPRFYVRTKLAPDVYRELVTYARKHKIKRETVVAEACRAYLGMAE